MEEYESDSMTCEINILQYDGNIGVLLFAVIIIVIDKRTFFLFSSF